MQALYEELRRQLIDLVDTVLGTEKWQKRKDKEDSALCTVLGLTEGQGENCEGHEKPPSSILGEVDAQSDQEV